MRSSSPDREPGTGESAARSLIQLSDAALVARCAEGDGPAWRTLVERYRRLIYTIPYRMGLRAADADEIFQITFCELADRIETLRQPERVRAWLVTAARRAALKTATRTREGSPEPLLHLPDPTELPSEELERLQDQQLVRTALGRLGERCRKLLTRLYYRRGTPGEGGSYEEIARELGMPLGSVGPTRIRCLKKLLVEFRGLADE
jgi:RNA polymerase sigma factor (sigma-70 family)